MQHPVPEVYARVKIFRLLAIRYPGGGGYSKSATKAWYTKKQPRWQKKLLIVPSRTR
jgi:hypothetical protein